MSMQQKLKKLIDSSFKLFISTVNNNFLINIPILTLTTLISIFIFILLCFLLPHIIILKENLTIKNEIPKELLSFWIPEPYERVFYFLGILIIPTLSLLQLFIMKLLYNRFINKNIFSSRKSSNKNIDVKRTQVNRSCLLEIFIILIIIAFTFNERLNDYIILHETNFILPVINDIFNGKFMLVNTFSQYGLLNIYLLTLVFKFLPLTYSSIYLVVSLGFVIEYLLVYIFFRSFLKPMFALFALLLTFYYASGLPFFYEFGFRVPAYTSVPGSLIRTFPFFSILLLLYLINIKKVQNKLLTYLPYFLSGIYIFWSLDTGLPVLLAIIMTLMFDLLINNFTKESLYFFIRKASCIFFGFVIAGIFITIITKIFSGNYPDWNTYIKYVNIYSAGYFMLPLPKFYLPYYAVLMMYLISLYYLFFTVLLKNKEKYLQIIVFITFFGIIYFNYYLGRSHKWVLPAVSLPALMLFIYYSKILLYDTYNLQNIKFKKIILIYAIIPIYFIVDAFIKFIPIMPGVLLSFHQGLPLIMNKINFNKQNIKTSNDFDKAVEIISRLSVNEKKIGLLTEPNYQLLDALLLIYTNKINIMPTASLFYYISESDRKAAIAKIKLAMPKYIFVQNSPLAQNYFKELNINRYYEVYVDKPITVYKKIINNK